ncbi:MAG: hypothetical protein ACNYPD_05950 [Candidatus Halichondribacter symbioticus]
MTQTNKPLVFLRLTPVLLPVVLLASVFMITACGGGKSKALPAPRPAPAFTSRVIEEVDSDIQSDITEILAEQTAELQPVLLGVLGEDYLETLRVNIPRGARVETLYLQGEIGGGGLGAQDGFLMVFVGDSVDNFAHTVIGIFDTIEVGNPLDNTASATFSGKYTARLLWLPTATPEDPNPLADIEVIDGEPFTLNVDFEQGEIRADVTSADNARLEVDGNFRGNNLFGDVTFTSDSTNTEFEAPLTGFIGQDGAVGIFASHNNGAGTRYSLGGGFVVEPDPAPDPETEPANNN